MLPSSHRLPKEAVSDLMRSGMRVTTDELLLRYKKTSTGLRFAFVVSTKIDKRATRRNRMRRTLSESIRLLMPRILTFDGVIVVRKNIAELSQKDVEVLIEKLLLRAYLIS